MNKFKKISLAVTLLVAMTVAQAENFVVATGDGKSGSTYARMYKELAQRCNYSATGLTLAEQETTGSVKNVELLTGNQVNAAIVQSDLLFWTKMKDETKVANVRTLFALHPEELHFVARADTKKEGGFGVGSFKVGGTSITYNSVQDLTGRTVGAVGGSVMSANVVSAKSGLNFSVQEYPNNDAMKQDLLEGKIDAIVAVGGSPLGLVSSLDQRYRLLPVTESVQKALADIYQPAKLSYTNLNQAGVPTLATQALFVSRTYRSQDVQSQLKKLRDCFVKVVPDIQDARGTHSKWQSVDTADKGKWAYYEFK